jgi:hypothetical protein
MGLSAQILPIAVLRTILQGFASGSRSCKVAKQKDYRNI